MREAIPVEAHFDSKGTLRPKAFLWRGERMRIDSAGRSWEAGEYRHFLVQVDGQGTFELAYHLEEHHWHLRRNPSDFSPYKPVI